MTELERLRQENEILKRTLARSIRQSETNLMQKILAIAEKQCGDVVAFRRVIAEQLRKNAEEERQAEA